MLAQLLIFWTTIKVWLSEGIVHKQVHTFCIMSFTDNLSNSFCVCMRRLLLNFYLVQLFCVNLKVKSYYEQGSSGGYTVVYDVYHNWIYLEFLETSYILHSYSVLSSLNPLPIGYNLWVFSPLHHRPRISKSLKQCFQYYSNENYIRDQIILHLIHVCIRHIALIVQIIF